MAIPKTPLVAGLMRFASGLKFRYLFFLTGALFLFDLLTPDPIPLLDELVLGLLTLLFASWKKEGRDRKTPADPSVIEGEVVRDDRSPDRKA
ncbi:MAG: hypothetical protein P8Z78_01055 [Gammaproteobacteria bacterium]|jgi:hypothetical protein